MKPFDETDDILIPRVYPDETWWLNRFSYLVSFCLRLRLMGRTELAWIFLIPSQPVSVLKEVEGALGSFAGFFEKPEAMPPSIGKWGVNDLLRVFIHDKRVGIVAV